MTRKQLLLVAAAILAVLGAVLWVLLSRNLVGIAVLGVSTVIVIFVAGSWSRLHLMRALFRPAVKREDLETRVSEWVQSQERWLAGMRDLDWDRLYVRLDEDDHYRALKAQYANATSPVDQEIAFRQARELVRKQARAMRGAPSAAGGR